MPKTQITQNDGYGVSNYKGNKIYRVTYKAQYLLVKKNMVEHSFNSKKECQRFIDDRQKGNSK